MHLIEILYGTLMWYKEMIMMPQGYKAIFPALVSTYLGKGINCTQSATSLYHHWLHCQRCSRRVGFPLLLPLLPGCPSAGCFRD